MINNNIWEFSSPEIHFGYNCFEKIFPKIIREKDNILIITEKEFQEQNYRINKVLKYFEIEQKKFFLYEVEDNNDDFENISKGLKIAEDFKPSLIIALGSYFIISISKIISVKITNTGDLSNFTGIDKFKFPGIPVAVIPFYSGNGIETTDFAFITKQDKHNNISVSNFFKSKFLLPKYVITDPSFSVNNTQLTIISDGLNILKNSIEAFISSDDMKISTSLAETAIEKTVINLIQASGNDLESKLQLSYSSLLAGLSISNSKFSLLTYISTELYYISGVPIGIFTGILLPHILNFFAPTITKKMIRLNKILNLKSNGNSFLDNIKLPGDFFKKFLLELDIPVTLKDTGITKSKLSTCAKSVINLTEANSLFFSPKNVNKDDITEILLRAYE